MPLYIQNMILSCRIRFCLTGTLEDQIRFLYEEQLWRQYPTNHIVTAEMIDTIYNEAKEHIKHLYDDS